MSAAGAGAALQSVGQGLMNLGIRSAEHDYQRERMAAEEEMRLRAEQRAEARTIGSEKRQVENRIAEESRVIERRKGIIQGVDEEVSRITANRAGDAEVGGMDATPAPNRAAMIRDRAAISDPDLARLYGDTETREYQRTRDAKGDERADRGEARQDRQLAISERVATEGSPELRYTKEKDSERKAAGSAYGEALGNPDLTAAQKVKARAAAVSAGVDVTRIDTASGDKSTIAQLAAQYGKMAEDVMADESDRAYYRAQQRQLLDLAAGRKGGESAPAATANKPAEVPKFSNENGIAAAIKAGQLKYGDVVEMNGKKFKVQE